MISVVVVIFIVTVVVVAFPYHAAVDRTPLVTYEYMHLTVLSPHVHE